jgi:hypothetical protein
MIANNPRLGSAESVAAAYHQGRVFVFADSIYSPNHLRFVLSHEILGHHGLRALIGRDKLSKVLDGLYQESQMGLRVGTWLANSVDAMRARNPDIGKLEAIEEVLADKAAALGAEPGVLLRIFKAIEKAIKRFFGVDNPEDLALYTLHQARKYLRTGTLTSGFSLDTVIQDAVALGEKSGQFDSVVLHENPTLAEVQQGHYEAGDHTAAAALPARWASLGRSSNDFVHDFFSLQTFSARENPGYQRMYKLFDNARNTASRIRQTANERLARFFGMSGPVELELNRMLYIGDALRTNETLETTRVLDENGNERSVVSSRAMTDIMGPDALTPLFDYLDMGKRPPDLNFGALDPFFDKGVVSMEDFKRGITVKRKNSTSNYAPNKDMTEAQYKQAYEAYLEFRKAYRDTEEELVRAKYGNVIEGVNVGWEDLMFSAQNSLGQVGAIDNARNLAIFHEIHRRAIGDLLNARVEVDGGTITNSKDVLEAVNGFAIAVNTFLRAKDPNVTDPGVQERANAIRQYFPGQNIDLFLTQLNQMRESMGYRYSQFDGGRTAIIQESVKNAAQEHFAALRDEYRMKWSLIRGYTPIMREGNLQVRVVAVNPATGKPVSVGQDFQSQLLFSLFKDDALGKESGRANALQLAKQLNDEFSGKQFDMANEVETTAEAHNRDSTPKVALRAVVEDAPAGVYAPPSVDPAAFLRAINAFGVNLSQRDTNTIIEALTNQDNKMRNQLLRENKPGYGYLGNKALSKHIEQRASVAGKASISSRLNHLYGKSDRATNLWAGDGARVRRLTDELAALPEESTERASKQRELDLAQFQFDKTNPANGPDRTGTYKNRGYASLQFYDGQSDVEFSQFDLNGTVSTLRTMTSLAYLGGSIASGLLNIISVGTNVVPFLATYNSKRGFGGGFGLHKASAEITAALKTMASAKSFTGKVITRQGEPSQDPNNAAYYEARFLTQEIREVKMIPAISNMVMYSARGMPSSLTKFAQPIDAYMTFFNQTEQYSRRASGLAAYRLHRNRALTEAGTGSVDLQAVYTNAREFAAEMLDQTVGEYSAMNRPPIFRNNFLSLLYTYKTFPTTMIQLMRNLPKSGQAAMLGALWFTGGVMAFPFAEDLEDIADTIGQQLGLGGSSRLWAQRMLNGAYPGLDALVMRGAMQNFPILGTMDVGSRLSLANVVPFPGSALAGQNVLNDVKEFAGPIVSFGLDSSKTGAMLTGETARLVTGEPTEFAQVLRQSPVTAMRYLSDIWTYSATGAITNKRGAVIAPGEQYAGIFARALGFYPQSAARANDFARLVIRDSQFHRQMSGALRDRYVRARLQGNPDEAAAIQEYVMQWNLDNPDQMINNFTKNADRAFKLWSQTAQSRLLASTPKGLRARFQEINNEGE